MRCKGECLDQLVNMVCSICHAEMSDADDVTWLKCRSQCPQGTNVRPNWNSARELVNPPGGVVQTKQACTFHEVVSSVAHCRTPLVALPCGHVYHTRCFQRNERIRHRSQLPLTCPLCNAPASKCTGGEKFEPGDPDRLDDPEGRFFFKSSDGYSRRGEDPDFKPRRKVKKDEHSVATRTRASTHTHRRRGGSGPARSGSSNAIVAVACASACVVVLTWLSVSSSFA